MQTSADTTKARKSLHGPRHDAAGASPNHCNDNCVRPTPSQAHCAARGCHRTFGGVYNFDTHRRDGQCMDPATLGMVLTAAGIWRTPMPDAARERLAARTDTRDDRQEQ